MNYTPTPEHIERAEARAEQVMIVSTWVAGWNMPGYLPESDPAEFEEWSDALTYLREEIDRDWDNAESAAEGDRLYLELHTAIHNASTEEPFYGTDADGRLAYWINYVEEEA